MKRSLCFLFASLLSISSFAETVVRLDPLRPLPSKPASGTTYVLKRGATYEAPAGGVVIYGTATSFVAEPGTGAKPVVHFRGQNFEGAFFDRGTNTRIENLQGDIGSKNWLVRIDGGKRGGKLVGVELLKGGGIQTAAFPVDGYSIVWCGANVPTDSGMFYFGGRGDVHNRNIVFYECWAKGSINEHVVRLHNVEGELKPDGTRGVGVWFEKCRFENDERAGWAKKKGASFNLRDVFDVTVLNCAGSGQFILGPLADADGGINEPAGAERDRKLSLRAGRIFVKDFLSLGGYVILEAGLSDFVIDGFRGSVVGGGGYAINAEKAYGPRKPPAGKIQNVDLKNGKQGIAGTYAGIDLKNFVFNGKPVENRQR